MGGSALPISIINRAASSGSRATFDAIIMNGEQAIQSQEQDSNGMVKSIVGSNTRSYFILGFAYLDDSIKTIKLNGFEPTTENVTTNDYQFGPTNTCNTKGEPDGLTKEFLDYMYSDEVQEGIVVSMGYISINQMKVEKSADGVVSVKE